MTLTRPPIDDMIDAAFHPEDRNSDMTAASKDAHTLSSILLDSHRLFMTNLEHYAIKVLARAAVWCLFEKGYSRDHIDTECFAAFADAWNDEAERLLPAPPPGRVVLRADSAGKDICVLRTDTVCDVFHKFPNTTEGLAAALEFCVREDYIIEGISK